MHQYLTRSGNRLPSDLGTFMICTNSNILFRREFIEKMYPWFLKTYDGYTQEIMRIDAVRYFILHYFGGIYLDIDMECKVCKIFDNTPYNVRRKVYQLSTMRTHVRLLRKTIGIFRNSFLTGKCS